MPETVRESFKIRWLCWSDPLSSQISDEKSQTDLGMGVLLSYTPTLPPESEANIAMSIRALLSVLAVSCIACSLAAQDLPYVNWESHPVHALDLSPSKSILAVSHTADNRVQLFDVSEGQPVFIGHVVVGVDPVSVRFRSESELWVVNHISDSISVVDLTSFRVVRTLATADEPSDVVFAGNPSRAYVSCSQANLIYVFDPADPTSPPEVIEIAAEEPKALAISPDGLRVYAAIFESGNGSTLLGGGVDEIDTLSFPPNVTRQLNTPCSGSLRKRHPMAHRRWPEF